MPYGRSGLSASNAAASAAKPNDIGANLDFEADLHLADDKPTRHLGSLNLLLESAVVKAPRGRPYE